MSRRSRRLTLKLVVQQCEVEDSQVKGSGVKCGGVEGVKTNESA